MVGIRTMGCNGVMGSVGLGFRPHRRRLGKWPAFERYVVLSVASEGYEPPANSSSFARNSLTVIPIARAVVSARLSLGPRSTPIAASREASRSAGDSHGTAGGATLRIAFSSRANRDLSLDCISLSVRQNSGDGRSPAAWLFAHLIDDFERDAAYALRRLFAALFLAAFLVAAFFRAVFLALAGCALAASALFCAHRRRKAS
jgi:hypothetical protein